MSEEPPYLRTSERKSFRRCPQQWWWAWVQGLRSKGRPATQLWFGTGVHIALAEWYDGGFHRGPHPSDTFAKWVGEEVEDIRVLTEVTEDDKNIMVEEFLDAKELGISLLDRYVAAYGKDKDLETLAVEQPFQVEIVDSNGNVIAIFSGTFDGAFLDHRDGRIYLWEHKTASRISTAYLSLDDQAGGYYAVADTVLRHQGILAKNEHIDAVLYNFIRKAAEDDRPINKEGLYLNKDGSVSKQQPGPVFYREPVSRNRREVQQQFRRMRNEVTIMNKMRTGELPVIKNTAWDCPRCPFYAMCVLDEKNPRAARELMDQGFVTYDPYLEHRKSAAELCITSSTRSEERLATTAV